SSGDMLQTSLGSMLAIGCRGRKSIDRQAVAAQSPDRAFAVEDGAVKRGEPLVPLVSISRVYVGRVIGGASVIACAIGHCLGAAFLARVITGDGVDSVVMAFGAADFPFADEARVGVAECGEVQGSSS